MPFYGPQGGGRAVRPFDAYSFNEALDRAQNQRPSSSGRSELRTDLYEEENRQRNRNEDVSAEMAMTPGVRQGVGNSDILRNFKRGGQDYNFDPRAAGVDEGSRIGARETTADEAKFEALASMPGFDRQSAARQVFGRTQESDDVAMQPMRAALASYMKSPSRELAAKAIEVGAAINQFPDRFAGEEVRGHPVKGPGGELGMQDPMTGEVTWGTVAGTDDPAVGALPSSTRSSTGPTAADRQIASQQTYTNSLRATANQMIPKKRPPAADPGNYASYDTSGNAERRFVADSTARERQFGDPYRAAQAKLGLMHDSEAPPTGGAPSRDILDVMKATPAGPTGGTGPTATAASVGVTTPSASLEELTADHADVIAKIRASGVSQAAKDEAIRQANAAFREDVAKIKGG